MHTTVDTEGKIVEELTKLPKNSVDDFYLKVETFAHAWVRSVKLQKMMEPTDYQISNPHIGGLSKQLEKPALSDRDFRSFLDNVGELVR